MKKFRLVLLLALSFMTAACSQAVMAIINVPVAFSEMKVARDVVYGQKAWQKLDIYGPVAPGKYPVIVFLYGGRWTFGTKKEYAFIADTLVRHGYVVVIPDYAKYPAVKFPVFVEDAAKALAWAHDHIGDHDGDAKQIYLMGHSAGAHIGALVISDVRYLEAEKKSPQIVRAFAGLAGPYDFTPDEPDLKDMFGPPENYPKMQVTNFITGHEPPMLLIRGDRDPVVKDYNIDRVKGRVDEKNGRIKVIVYPGMDHMWPIRAFTWTGRGKYTIVDDVLKFFSENH